MIKIKKELFKIKNPYYFNLLGLGIIIFVILFLLFGSFLFPYCSFYLNKLPEEILIGVLSSAALLLFIEVMNFYSDRKRYSFLKGKYKRVVISEVNTNRLRGSEIPIGIENYEERTKARKKEESEKNIKYKTDSCYHELNYYDCETIDYFIELNYQYHGIYIGYIEYYDDNKSCWRENKIIKIKAKITLNLNQANIMTGLGSYKYSGRDDLGKYDFRVDDENQNRIIVNYQNRIPSGLAEGYEIWERCDLPHINNKITKPIKSK